MNGVNIIHGHVILPGADKAEPMHLHIEDGKIASVGKAAPIAGHVDASGLIVAPGIIDFGVVKTDQPALRSPVITGYAEFGRLGCGDRCLLNETDLADLAVGITEHHITGLTARQVVVGDIPPAVSSDLG